MNFTLNSGDTNFIGVVDAAEYQSFVNGNWRLDMLIQHFSSEMEKGHILVYSMTDEGNEHSWKVEVQIGMEEIVRNCFRKAVGFIQVTDNKLYLVDYDCLTMAAQFESEKVPSDRCSKYKVDIDNGIYKVEAVQFYNADKDEHTGNDDVDLLLNFIKVASFKQGDNTVFWYT